MNMLTLDSSSINGALALFINDKRAGERHYSRERQISVHLVNDISKIIEENKLELNDIDYFSLTIGPGSFTGLRIGLATIKSIAWALQKPIIPVSTLLALAYNVQEEESLICSMIDAKRNDIYGAAFLYTNGNYKRKIEDSTYKPNDFLDRVSEERNSQCIFLGDGALLYKNLLIGASLREITTIKSEHLFSIAESAIKNDRRKILTRVNELEPNYCANEFKSYPKS